MAVDAMIERSPKTKAGLGFSLSLGMLNPDISCSAFSFQLDERWTNARHLLARPTGWDTPRRFGKVTVEHLCSEDYALRTGSPNEEAGEIFGDACYHDELSGKGPLYESARDGFEKTWYESLLAQLFPARAGHVDSSTVDVTLSQTRNRVNSNAMVGGDCSGSAELDGAQSNQSSSSGLSGRRRSPLASSSCSRKKISREQFLALISASKPQPRDIESQQANMMQLYQTFLNLYMPHDGDQRTLMSILTISESSPALCSASKTISLLLLHRVIGEARLLRSVNSLYSDALRHARREAADSNADTCILIGTAHFLSLCELFQRVSLDDSGTTRPHANWLISLMETHRRDTDNDRLQRILHSNVRLVATWEMLIARRSPCSVATLPHSNELSTGTVTSMSDLTLLTSDLLEQCDRMCSEDRDHSLSLVLDTIAKIVRLEGLLHAWIASYLKTSCGSPYRLVETSSLPYLTSRGTHVLFRRIYDFTDLQVQILFISYWMCQLMLVDAHIDITRSYKDKLDTDPTEIIRLKRLANEYADHLSRSMPTLGVPYAAWAGRTMAVRPLHLLLLHYRQHKEWQKLSWCVECAKDIGILVDKSCMKSRNET